MEKGWLAGYLPTVLKLNDVRGGQTCRVCSPGRGVKG